MLGQGVFNVILWVVQIALTLFALFALVDAALRREDAYRAADKKTKPFWLVVLALSTAAMYFMAYFWFLAIFALVATIVYMVDVRPAVREVAGPRGRGRGRSSSDGPYGPYNG
jgi:hypothetical protein